MDASKHVFTLHEGGCERRRIGARLQIVGHHKLIGACTTGQQRLDAAPLLVRQIARVALGLGFDPGHPATAFRGPHGQRESPGAEPLQPFSNSL